MDNNTNSHVLNNNNTILVDKVMELLEIKQKFLSNKDIDTAYYILMQDVLNFFQVDRIIITMKSVLKNECLPIVEYIRGKDVNFFGEVLDFDGFAKFCSFDTNKSEDKFIKICNENNYFFGNDFNKLQDILPYIGYVPSDMGNPEEVLTFYIKNKESFSVMIMERYNNFDENNKKIFYRDKFSHIEKLALKDIHNMLACRIEITTLQERLHNEMHMKNLIIENEKIPICIIEKSENRVIYYNENYKNYMPNVKIGTCYDEIFTENDEYLEVLGHSKSVISQNKNKDDNYSNSNIKYWIKKLIHFNLLDGIEVCMVYMKDAEDYIQELKGIDILTSAYSLHGFLEHFEKLISKDDNYMLCTFDIDKFKYINDSFSFEFGNNILRKIAIVLGKFVRNQEIFCRMSEDKFAILLQCNTKDEVKARINELFEKLEIMKKEYFLDVKLTYIFGVIAIDKNIHSSDKNKNFSKEFSKEESINIFIDRANNARKTAKGAHKNTIAFFDEEAEEKARQELLIEARVSKAVENGEFIPYLQPKFDLEKMEICGAEALVRWISPTGMIFPDSFIPLFEKNGFIDTLDFIIYKKVMQHIRECLDNNLSVYTISLNVSRNHIQNKNFIDEFMLLITEYQIPIELIELEVTESVFIEDRALLKYFIDNIKKPKIKVSIDDFGTAYSSLQVLKDIDIDILKIDKGFLSNIDFSDKHKFTKDEVVLKNIINLARDLDCKVICEGIETLEQVKLLKEIGCEYGQGYVFSKPIPMENYIEQYLKNKNS